MAQTPSSTRQTARQLSSSASSIATATTTFVNGQSGKALDVDGGSPLPPTNVQQWTMSATNANQQFIAIKNSDGTYSFVNRASGLALRAGTGSVGNGTNLDAAVRDGSKYQRFTLHEQKMSIADGLYSMRPAGSTATALEASGQGAPTTPTYQGDASQKWFIDSSDSTPGAYTIESMSSGLKLTATSQTAVALQKTTARKTSSGSRASATVRSTRSRIARRART